MAGDLFKRLVRLLRTNNLHHLDLIELMLPDQAPRVAAVRARLGAKAGSVRGELDGKLRLLENGVANRVGKCHLRGRDEVHVTMLPPGVDRVQVLLELGELPCSHERLAVDNVGSVALLVPVLARVRVEHELRQGAVKPRHVSPHQDEAGAGNLDTLCKVHAEKPLRNIDMVLDLKGELARLADLAHLHVSLLVLSLWHRAVGGVWDTSQENIKLLLDLLERMLGRLKLALQALDRCHHIRRVLPVGLHLSDAL
mmetsp:Transcript_29032/g.67901  ORF Transcript_29032/g.67901 Transcript_29032/m.67901 type:complete len:254 (-) Transcript_29032:462-1223(-)